MKSCMAADPIGPWKLISEWGAILKPFRLQLPSDMSAANYYIFSGQIFHKFVSAYKSKSYALQY